MKTEDKEKRLRKTLDLMTETELKEICFDSFIDGLEKGIMIKSLKNTNIDEKSA